MMRPTVRRRVRLFVGLLLVGALVGAAYGGVIGHLFRNTGLIGASVGMIDGVVIAAPIAVIEIFLLRTQWGRRLQRAPFLVTFGVKWIAYGTLISIVNLRSVGTLVLGLMSLAAPLPLSVALWSGVFSFAAALAILFVLQVSQMVGPRNLGHIIFGRYHQPRLEERFFLFVDIRGSTTLAEHLEPVAVHRFLARVFSLASDPVTDHGGEIYQYVGDEMVVTWRMADGRRDARPLACFFAIEAAIDHEGAGFQRDFGLVPQLRGALHLGPVIVGEVGDTKREIVFHGDVMNTAARLEQATRELGRPFLASAHALRHLQDTGAYVLMPLGPHTLRGRQGLVEIYSVTATRP
jgi:adenylate cyclase